MERSAKIYVAGHRGMVGSALVRKLKAEGFSNLVLRGSDELDLRNGEAVAGFFAAERPDYVFLAAAKVGGIIANDTFRGEFIYDNLMIQSHLIHQAKVWGVKKLLFLGSSCIYPKFAPQPLKEEYLLTGPLEPTNEPYAVAKIAGIKMCDAYRDQYGCDFISAMPTNLYGPNDNYDLQSSHVLPALLRKFYESARDGAASVTIWGDGSPLREFMHVDDMAAACLHLMQEFSGPGPVNVGTGSDIPIADLARQLKQLTGFSGELIFDRSKPNGTPRKLMDVSKLQALGFQAGISLEAGLKATLEDFAENYARYTA